MNNINTLVKLKVVDPVRLDNPSSNTLQIVLYLTLKWGYFRPKDKNTKIFKNHLNQVMLVFIG